MPEITINGVQMCTMSGGIKPKQETSRDEKCYTNMDSISKLRYDKTKAMVKTKSHKTTEYFLLGPNYESDKKKSTETTQ